jgi:hypothetical protein
VRILRDDTLTTNKPFRRREFLATAGAASLGGIVPTSNTKTKLGIDLFSLRSQTWTPLEALDYCAARKVQLVHFSEIRFIGNLLPENLRAVREACPKA